MHLGLEQIFVFLSILLSSSQGLPPFWAVWLRSFTLLCIPCPQLTLHFEYSPNSFHVQSTRIKVDGEIIFWTDWDINYVVQLLDILKNMLTGTVMFRNLSGETEVASSIIVYILKQIFCATSRPFSNTPAAGHFIHYCSPLRAFNSYTWKSWR